MLSTFPATFPATFPSDFGAPFPDFNSDFTPWDDLSYLFEPIPTLPKPDPVDPPFYSSPTTDDDPFDPNSDYPSPDSCENPSPKTVTSGSGSDSDQPVELSTIPVPEPDPAGSGSDPNKGNPGGPGSIMEERKRKRKLSNRDSARRSRMRKQKHVEDLVGEVNRLEMENRELTNRVKLYNHYSEITRRENERLWGDCVILRRRLTLITQILHSPQLHANPMTILYT